ncbi:MAG: RNA methyltransferase [Alphaproteobacteria bacterium]|nr:RNA methyltransferase [Alphaproteobacteria bacterium]USO07433.1 MAG: RNA methyltransferase [Rhodospirillales bacterium]
MTDQPPAPMPPAPTPPAIVLVNPQLGENIGMCARAMFNCGLADLRIVNPRDGWPSEKAVAASSGALEKGVVARVYADTAAAVADCTYILATTARPRDMVKEVLTPRAAGAALRAAGGQCAVLFGAERTGLVNEDVALANAVVTIPLNPAFTSLNIAQAVLLVAYEWFTAGDSTAPAQLLCGDSDIAPAAEIATLVARLEGEMEAGGFFRSAELRPTLVRNLQALFARTRMTSQEASTFHGIISALIGLRTGPRQSGA